ncbi:1-aminocyclopropane-1-carboxylate deaminase/D-cysteine desulfhydrase [Aestuariibacter salexigens]|uniref:1-aminocyclopropane-1-carboxylate deaminase/D-cysteine desulfhydrase n=1 Tax=Aestuariibacter salexigens TaxID=226010 RepID=UPI000411A7BD|nr:pyridoxal-phosphate dependent enzyme [Aestuariibacter salexigens]
MSIQRLKALQKIMQIPSAETPLTFKDIGNCKVVLKRDDLIHPIVSGNKWRKLQPQLEYAVQNGVAHVVSLGGGYSNHLHALGYCCRELDINCTALIRGDYTQHLTPMLRDLNEWGVKLHYLTKREFAERNTSAFADWVKHTYPDSHMIPEGGSHPLALGGVAEAMQELEQHYDYIILPVASGATMAGIIAASQPTTTIIGIGVLKGEGYLEGLVKRFMDEQNITATNWTILHDYHCGGYARSTPELTAFCRQFSEQNEIDIEPVYSGKTLMALTHLLRNHYFPDGCRILCWHTGGLQGARID